MRSLGLELDDNVSIDLRGSLDKVAFLRIGDGIEIVVRESHVRTLREQATAALDDMAHVEAAEAVLENAFHAGAQARTAAALARETANAAQQAGADDPAEVAYAAAQRAGDAAERAQAAVKAASEAMCAADEAAETARAAAVHLAEWVGRQPS
ncbi:hypothetical protein A6A25_27345 [Saccharothrix sp. CB00851]|nr:hypothetical protein A6A25_27345 [Saccharothrix sp. CB00851]